MQEDKSSRTRNSDKMVSCECTLVIYKLLNQERVSLGRVHEGLLLQTNPIPENHAELMGDGKRQRGEASQ